MSHFGVLHWQQWKPPTSAPGDEFNVVPGALKNCNPKKSEYKKYKITLLDNATRFYDGREMIIYAFENKIFPLNYNEEGESHFEDENEIRNENGLINY